MIIERQGINFRRLPLYILTALASLCFIWIMIPRIHLLYYTSTIVGLSALIISFILSSIYTRAKHLFNILFLLTLGKCIITFFIPAALDFNIGFLSIIENSFYILSIILSYIIIEYKLKKTALILIGIIALSYYIVYSATTPVLATYHNAARDLAGGGDPAQLLIWRLANVGGFGFSYCSAPIGLLALEITIKSNKLLIKILSAFIFCNIAVLIFIVQYTTLLVFFVVCAIFLIYRQLKNKIVTAIIIIGALLFTAFFKDIMFYISEYARGLGLDALSHHFDDFGDTADGRYLRSKRDDLAKVALSIWMESPIWGNWSILVPSNPLYETVMESHTGVGTLLATTGLIGLSLMSSFLYIGWKYIHQLLQKKGCDSLVFDMSFIFMIIVWFINPITGFYELELMVFSFVPLATYRFNKYMHAKKYK